MLPVEFCAAVALLLDWELIWEVVLDWKFWAITLQFVGALIASGGLACAYLRATRFRERTWPGIKDQLRRIRYKLRGGGPVITGTSSPTLQLLPGTENDDDAVTLDEDEDGGVGHHLDGVIVAVTASSAR